FGIELVCARAIACDLVEDRAQLRQLTAVELEQARRAKEEHPRGPQGASRGKVALRSGPIRLFDEPAPPAPATRPPTAAFDIAKAGLWPRRADADGRDPAVLAGEKRAPQRVPVRLFARDKLIRRNDRDRGVGIARQCLDCAETNRGCGVARLR